MSESAELEPWQQRALEKFKGKGTLQITGRQTGKSYFSAQALKRLMEDLQNRPVEDLIQSEGRVFGARYHTIEPVGGNWVEMEAWCTQTFGEPAEVWDLKDTQYIWPEMGRWYKNDRKFWFRNERDRDWFIIKWHS